MMGRVLCLLAGYFFGSFQSGYVLSRLRGFDIRSYGSRSTGATNSLRVMGAKAGGLVLLGDALKALIPCLAARLFYAGQPDIQLLMVLWTALGVTLGHDYPFYLGFRGGKGVASAVGALIAFDPRLALAWCALFLAVVLLKKYVSLASVAAMFFLIALCFAAALRGALPVAERFSREFTLLAVFLPALSIWRHRSNLSRLLRGTESKVNLRSRGMEVGKK